MAPRRPTHNDGELISPKANYYGSLADYKESMTEPIDTDTTTNIPNNTTFVKEKDYNWNNRRGGNRFLQNVPVFPQPQPIKDMPVQLAGYTDYARKEEDRFKAILNVAQNTQGLRINTAGKPAVGVTIDNIQNAQDFINTKSVFVNPKFKDPYDKIGNDPDSSDRSRGPLIVPRERLNTLRAMSAGVNQ